ncbi:MAG: Na(+)/H(+) antiporter subunit B [Clostridiales bacterium]|nr:Na(+)/H(+) antiporter subunit B [Clostridiales bacterium]
MRKVFTAIFIVLFGVVLLLGIARSIPLTEYDKEIGPDKSGGRYIDKNVNADPETDNIFRPDEVLFGKTDNAETGSANMVTSIVVNYRSFDTLGEVTVLFLAAVGISIFMGDRSKNKKRKKSGFILKTAAGYIFPIMLLTGIYIFTHGHLTPGGGFPGGSMIASSFLLLYMADDKFELNLSRFKIAEGTAGTLYVLLGAAGLIIGGYFLMNFLPTGTVGDLFSAGLVPIVYVLIGLKVGSEITGVISDMTKEEVSL